MKRPIIIMVWTAVAVLSFGVGFFHGLRDATFDSTTTPLAVAIMVVPLVLFVGILFSYWQLSRWAALLILGGMALQTVNFVTQGGHFFVGVPLAAISISWPVAFAASTALVWRRLHWGIFRPPAPRGPSVTEVFE